MKNAPVTALLGTAALVFGGIPDVLGLNAVDAFSPHNKNRAKRARTEVIVLHTTEGSAIGALAKLRKYGEANYLVDTKGKVYRIVEHSRVSHHAGVSMWNKLSSLNKYSVGIEVAGYHNKPVTNAQLKAIKELVAQLQSIYRVPDSRVLSHSMVAFKARPAPSSACSTMVAGSWKASMMSRSILPSMASLFTSRPIAGHTPGIS